MKKQRPLPRPFKMPWGKGEIIDEASYQSRWHEPTLQLMKFDNGEQLIRFAHYRKGRFQRSPLMIDLKDLGKMRASLRGHPHMKRALKKMLG